MAFVPNYDIHTHTVHCGHAHPEATPTEMARRATELGLAVYGISEHCMTAEHAAWLTLIREEVATLPPGPTRLLVGVELDPDPIALDGSFVVDPDVDYIIMAPHYLPGGTGHWEYRHQPTTPAERAALGTRWIDWYAATVERGGFEILAHPLREPMRLGLVDLRDAATYSRIVAIIARAADQSMVFELNNGWLHGLEEAGQTAEYTRLAKDARALGMRFSRGSDAHAPDEVGGAEYIHAFADVLGLQAHDWIEIDALLELHRQHTRRVATTV